MKKYLSILLVSIGALGTVNYASAAGKHGRQRAMPAKMESTKEAQASQAKGPSGQDLHNILTVAVAYKQTAAEFKALYHQAYNIARVQVDRALAKHKRGDKPLAVVSDLDDTVWIPYEYWGMLIKENKDFFDNDVWAQWIPQKRMVAAPGALDFFNYCKEKGVEVFYVTNRGPKTAQYALPQLQELKFPYADEKHVTVNVETSNKETRQKEIAQKYNIVCYLGDNLNDFARIFYVTDIDERTKLMEQFKHQFGSKFIIMPNPTDGQWIRAIFGDSEPPASDKNREIWKQAATRSAGK